MQQGEMLYEGKAKQVFRTDDDDVILMHYKDAATAFNNIKKATIEGKGVLNNKISTIIFGYLKEAGIPINIRNTNAPEDNGTWIVGSTCQKSKYVITGIAGKKGFCSVNIEKDMMNSEIGFGRKVLQVFEDNNLSFEHMPSGVDTMTVFVHQSEFEHKEQQVISGIHRAVHPDLLDLESGLALIAVVGRGMRDTRGVASKVFDALAKANINIKMIDQGSSELNIIIGVKEKYFEDAIKVIYDAFITNAAPAK